MKTLQSLFEFIVLIIGGQLIFLHDGYLLIFGVQLGLVILYHTGKAIINSLFNFITDVFL